MNPSITIVEKREAQSTHRYFAICDHCYWCASILSSFLAADFENCPACSKTLSLIPLSPDETYKLDFNSRGIEMTFARSR